MSEFDEIQYSQTCHSN